MSGASSLPIRMASWLSLEMCFMRTMKVFSPLDTIIGSPKSSSISRSSSKAVSVVEFSSNTTGAGETVLSSSTGVLASSDSSMVEMLCDSSSDVTVSSN